LRFADLRLVGVRCLVGQMIRGISLDEVLQVRHPVLRPGRERKDALFTCDGEAGTHHLGAFDETGRLVGVVTVHPADWGGDETGSWQLRGMATIPEVRGSGYGKALVHAAESWVSAAGGGRIWCHARTGAVGFYRRMDWVVVGEAFDIPSVGPHFRMYRLLGP